MTSYDVRIVDVRSGRVVSAVSGRHVRDDLPNPAAAIASGARRAARAALTVISAGTITFDPLPRRDAGLKHAIEHIARKVRDRP